MDYRRFLLEAYGGARAEMCGAHAEVRVRRCERGTRGRVGRYEGHALPCDVAFVD